MASTMLNARHSMPATPDAVFGLFDPRSVTDMRDALGQANLDELLDLLLVDLGKRPSAIARAAADRDWNALRHEAHLLLGSVRCVGGITIAECLIAIESAAREQTIAGERVSALARDAGSLHAAIVEYRRAAQRHATLY